MIDWLIDWMIDLPTGPTASESIISVCRVVSVILVAVSVIVDAGCRHSRVIHLLEVAIIIGPTGCGPRAGALKGVASAVLIIGFHGFWVRDDAWHGSGRMLKLLVNDAQLTSPKHINDSLNYKAHKSGRKKCRLWFFIYLIIYAEKCACQSQLYQFNQVFTLPSTNHSAVMTFGDQSEAPRMQGMLPNPKAPPDGKCRSLGWAITHIWHPNLDRYKNPTCTALAIHQTRH